MVLHYTGFIRTVCSGEEKLEPVSRVDLLGAVSAPGSFRLFSAVASDQQVNSTLIKRLGLTRKQYYTRMSKLVKAGLIKRERGRYILTAFGKVIYELHLILSTAVDLRRRMKDIERMMM